MTSKFDLTRFYDVIICNSVFQAGFLTPEFQILEVVAENVSIFTSNINY